MALTQDFIDEIIGTLGGTLVDVELETPDIELCFKKAKRIFKQKGHYGYHREFYTLPVSKGETAFDVPAEIEDIVKIIKPSLGSMNPMMASIEDPMSMVMYNNIFYGTPSMGGCQRADFISFELALQMAETRTRYSAYEVQFSHDKFGNKLKVFKPAEKDGTWLLEAYRDLGDDEYQSIDWIIRWTVAEAKEMLGIAYRKFSNGIPGPMGEAGLNGDSYIQEAKQEKEQLLEDILNFTDGATDYMEIRFG